MGVSLAPARGQVIARISPDLLRLNAYFSQLEVIHLGYSIAASQIEAALGRSICMENCGQCCTTNSVVTLGLEAEYVASWLAGRPDLHYQIMDACREWLTRPGRYTFGKGFSQEWFASPQGQRELLQAAGEPCPFLDTDKKCMIHPARPLVCRAYSVLHQSPDCPRPKGLGEGPDSQMWFNANGRHFAGAPFPQTPTSLKEMEARLRLRIHEVRYLREGFVYFMLMERFHATELAGLMDDGRVPMIKVSVGLGGTVRLLYQEQLELEWKARFADESIAQQVPLKDVDGVPVMVIK